MAEHEIEHARGWPTEIKTYVNPLTSCVRVYDSTNNTTLFYHHIDGLAQPFAFEKVDDQWVVTFWRR